MGPRKLFIVVILLFQIFPAANAQTVEFLTGDKIHPDDPGSFSIIGYDYTRLYVFRVNGTGSKAEYRLQTYSRDSLRRLSSVRIPLPQSSSLKFKLEDFFIHKDYYQVLYSWFSSEKEQSSLDLISFNNEGNIIGYPKQIDFSEGKTKKETGYFNVVEVPEKNEFICSDANYTEGKLIFNIDHFDYEGNKIKSVTYDNVILRNVISWTLHKDGGLLFVTNNPDDSYNPDWRIKLYSPDSDSAYRIKLTRPYAEKKYLQSRFFSFNEDESIVNLITPYSDKHSGGRSNGVYRVKLNLKDHILLSEEFIPFNMDEKTKEDEDFSMASCIITDVMRVPDDKLVILFENRLMKIYSPDAKGDMDKFQVGNILAMEVEGNKTSGVMRIPKNQYLGRNNWCYTSFAVLRKDTKCYYFFSDLNENLDTTYTKKIPKLEDKNLNESSVVVVTTDHNAIQSKEVLIKNTNPAAIDALHMDKVAYGDENDLYTLRQIGGENFLVKIFIRE